MVGRPRKQRSAPLPVPPVSPEKGSDAHWYAVLPKPPRPMLGVTDELVARWMRDVFEAGGIEGLMWAWEPSHFAYPQHRGRMFHIITQLQAEAEARAKRLVQGAARDQQDRAMHEAHEAKVRAGWA